MDSVKNVFFFVFFLLFCLLPYHHIPPYTHNRTKWKRQTAVGLELLAEAGNYAAFQRLYGAPPYIGPWPYAQNPASAPQSAADLYYRQAAAAAALQKPLPYRLYPGNVTLFASFTFIQSKFIIIHFAYIV